MPDGGLPELKLQELLDLDYPSLAARLLSHFLPCSDTELIEDACKRAYSGFPVGVVPIVKVGEGSFVAELFHGRTAAFKDLALSLLPYLMTLSLKKTGTRGKVAILTATSGDTGKAALEGFRDVENTHIIVFYPTDGVSPVQKRQMVSQEGGNVTVMGIDGNFDDAQRAVKAAFEDEDVRKACSRKGVHLSSANSINIARLLPQCVYYFWSYLESVRQGGIKMGERVNFAVPSGNFGNCLSGWMASKMGLPVGRFLVASNPNHILTDFFSSGVYDTRREFLKTNAPAMDIMVSSNVERLLWYIEPSRAASMMDSLKETGSYSLSPDSLSKLQARFSAGYLTETEILDTIASCYREKRYLLDTHSACAYAFLERYRRQTGDNTPAVIMATASPYKFPDAVLEALTGEKMEPYTAMSRLVELTGVPVPEPLQGIEKRKIIHPGTIGRGDILQMVAQIIQNSL